MVEMIVVLDEEIRALNEQLKQRSREDETASLLQTAPEVGPMAVQTLTLSLVIDQKVGRIVVGLDADGIDAGLAHARSI